jgi:uncharacterized protein DUF1206
MGTSAGGLGRRWRHEESGSRHPRLAGRRVDRRRDRRRLRHRRRPASPSAHLAEASYGQWLLGATAAGLLAYGLFGLLQVRYHDV